VVVDRRYRSEDSGRKSQIGRCFSGTGFKLWSVSLLRLIALQVLTESLILAQNERWRRG
jgi:hypothetical protein